MDKNNKQDSLQNFGVGFNIRFVLSGALRLFISSIISIFIYLQFISLGFGIPLSLLLLFLVFVIFLTIITSLLRFLYDKCINSLKNSDKPEDKEALDKLNEVESILKRIEGYK